jgi:chemotaxis protein MotB
MKMSLGRKRRPVRHVDYWPGFVDALSTLLLSIMFLLSVFVLAQFLLSQEITGKDAVLNRLNSQINELTQLLSLERGNKQDLEDTIANLQASLTNAQSEQSRLQSLLSQGAGAGAAAEGKINELSTGLENEKQISARALSQVELLNQQIAALRRQIGALEEALNASESRDKESNAKIADLGKRLNVALAQRVQELNRYRSDFFGRLREILSDRENIRIVGDRFVFQSEVLFPSGAAVLNPAGSEEMKKLAAALIDLQKEIPEDINWVLRVDGHTDDIALSGTGQFKDNWELSSARAISVVKFLIANGVPANRLVAAGFGEFQPLEPGNTPEVRARNRRIELKLTER